MYSQFLKSNIINNASDIFIRPSQFFDMMKD